MVIITKLQVELVVSCCAVRLARHARMHAFDTSNVSRRAKWNLGYTL